MKFFNFTPKKKEERSDPILSRDDLWLEVASLAASGSNVTPDKAVQHAAVYACVKVIAETIATLPLLTYGRDKTGKRERATDLKVYDVLNVSPNLDLKMSRVDFFETMIAHCLLRGNAYAQIITSKTDVVKLVPIHPEKITPKVVQDGTKKTNKVIYEYHNAGVTTEIPASEILHIKDWSKDGVIGMSRISQTKDAIGLALAKDSYESLLYAQGTRLSGILEHPKALTDLVADRIGKSFREAYSGAPNMHKVAILEEGMQFKAMSMTNTDAEFIESRRLSVIDICRIFRVPPHVIADLTNSNFSNIENQSINFVIHTIRPWTVRIEQAVNRDVLSLADKRAHESIYSEFLIDGLLRGDQKSRYESYKIGLQNAFLSPNDIRNLENMNMIEGGERYFFPANNMVPLDRIDEYVDAQVRDNSKTAVVADSVADDSVDSEDEDKNAEADKAAEKKQKSREIAEEFRASYGTLLAESFQACVTKEVNDVKRMANANDAGQKITKFYSEKFPKLVTERLTTKVDAVAEQIAYFIGDVNSKDGRAIAATTLTAFAEKYANMRLKSMSTVDIRDFGKQIEELGADFALTKVNELVDSLVKNLFLD